MKSIFHPDRITFADVAYAIFNMKTKVEDDSDEFAANDDFVPMPTGRDNDRVKYKWVTPKDLPDGNPPSDIVWISETGTEYTAQELLDLCQEMRLGRAADLYGNHAHNAPEGPASPSPGPDAGSDAEANSQQEATQEELARELFGSDSE